MPNRQKLVYDWNLIGESEPLTDKRVLLDDETLRDGLQSPTVSDPAIEDKIHLLHLMEDLGIHFGHILQFPAAIGLFWIICRYIAHRLAWCFGSHVVDSPPRG